MLSPGICPWSVTAFERGLGHGVDQAGCDQAGDVPGVVVGRVLDAGGGPQRTLRPGSGPLQQPPPSGRDGLLATLVGEPGLGDGGLAAQRGGLRRADLVQPTVDLGVHAGHEERRHRGDAGQVPPGGAGGFQAGQECLDHLGVAGEGEDQRDVDADPLGQAGGDRGQALPGCRDLDEQVGPVDQPPQRAGLGDRAAGVVGDPRVDLDRHPPIHAAGCLVHRTQHVARLPHVGRGQLPQRLVHRHLAQLQVPDLAGVGVTVADGPREDRGVGRHSRDSPVAKCGEAAGPQPFPAEVIQPDRHSCCPQPGNRVCHHTSR